MKKIIISGIVVIFLLSFAACDGKNDLNASVVDKTHSVQKSIMVGDAEWIEIRTPSYNGGNNYKGLYELWLKKGNNPPLLIETFKEKESDFSKLEWGKNEENGINVNYWNGGPEGGISTNIVYNQNGSELVKVEQDIPFHAFEFLFQTPKNPKYKVNYLTETNCSDYTYKSDSNNISKVNLQGITIVSGAENQNIRNFLLPVVSTIECKVMDDGYYNPPITISNIKGDRMDFALANGQTVTLVYSLPANQYGLTKPELLLNGVVLPELIAQDQ